MRPQDNQTRERKMADNKIADFRPNEPNVAYIGEGVTVKGWPVITISRGEVVAEDGRVTEERGRGRFLRCDRSPLARSPISRSGGRRTTGFDPVSGRLSGL